MRVKILLDENYVCEFDVIEDKAMIFKRINNFETGFVQLTSHNGADVYIAKNSIKTISVTEESKDEA